ncbi:MAG: DEAD/DEAH box helicase [Bacteroidales bacterium]|nr:DEAD/DEAH box helicase [Bacteroidales bacterium]
MEQLKAGYFTNGINSLKTNEANSAKVDALTKRLCYFDLESSFGITKVSVDPAIAVIYNMVSRGTPAYASQFVEGILSTTIGKTLKRIDPDGNIYHEIQKDEVKDAVFKALHIIDPRITDSIPLHGENKDVLLNDFLFNIAKPLCGGFITQVAEKGRSFENMYKFSAANRRLMSTLKNDPAYEFLNENADLCFSAPYSDNSPECIVFNFDASTDGIDHTDYIKEEKVTELLKHINTDGRIIIKKDCDIDDAKERLSAFTQNSYFDILRQNYESPLYTTEDGIEALQIALTPPAAARIQKTVLEALNAGALSLDAKTWNICVIERDVPCAFIAFEDLKQHFNNLFTLENRGRKFPTVKLSIFYTPEFAETSQTLLYQGQRDDIKEFDPSVKYDMLIDVAMLQRSSDETAKPETAAAQYAIIRSAKSPKADTKLLFDSSILYNINIQKETPEDPDEPEDFDEQEDALRFFLKNIFLKKDFTPVQVDSISQLLNGKNILHVSPPGSGKTLIALFSAFMKPGYSIFLPPTIAVMKMQFAMLRSCNIDIDYYINPTLQNTYDRIMAVDAVTKGESVLTFISPSLMHDPYIRTVFKKIDSNNIPLYYIFVDEAQLISTQTPEFRPYYQDIKNTIARNFSFENICQVRLGAFTSSQEYNVKNEIVEKLGTDITFAYNQKLSEMPKITVHEIADDNTSGTGAEAYYHKLKQKLAEKLINNNKNAATIVYGAQLPLNQSDDESIAIYQGDTDEKSDAVTNSAAVDSSRKCKQFCNSQNGVMSAVRSAGIGIHAQNLNYAIHFEPPYSLDEFYRMNGRAKRGMVKKADVMLNTIQKEFAGTESVRDEKGNIKTVENIVDTNFDASYNLQRLEKLYPGQDKEKNVMHELLNGILYPQKSGKGNIQEAVFHEFGIEIEIEPEPMNEPFQLYIYANNHEKSLGYINFKTNEFVMPESTYDAPLAESIQSYIYDIITSNTESTLDYLAQMEFVQDAEECDGIQTIADTIKAGATGSLTVPFFNSEFKAAADILNTKIDHSIPARTLLRIYSQTSSLDEFEKLVASECGVNPKTLDDKSKIKFAALYSKFRNKRDTMRAITLLKEIELIDDYLVNPATCEITVTITKHELDYYKMKLLPVLSRNLTRDKALAYISSIENEKYLIIEKYTNVLIDFFYNEIYPLYQKLVLDCNTFFKTILEKQKSNSITQEMIASNLNNYFVSRYNCKFVYHNISDNIQNINNVLEILEQTGSNIGEMQHLQESLSQSIPENRTPANKIICGYCELFTAKTDDAVDRFNAYGLICEGLNEYRYNPENTVAKFEADTDAVTERITAENFDLKDEMENVMKLRLQAQWLKRFNSQILKIS